MRAVATFLLPAGLLLGAVRAAAQSCSLQRATLDPLGQDADQGSNQPAMTPDGRFVAFVSSATNLVPGDLNGLPDVFLCDTLLGTTELAGLGPLGVQGDGGPGYPALSQDGRWVAFQSNAGNLVPGDTNGTTDVFVWDRASGATARVSLGPAGAQGDGPSFAPTITPDGRYVVFASFAANLVALDANGQRDVFLHDRATGLTEIVSVSSAGAQGDGFSAGSTLLSFASADGRRVYFGSSATNLVPNDANGVTDVFVRDRLLGTTERLVLGLGGAEPDGAVDVLSITPDARFLGLSSSATNLVPGDANQSADAFVLDLASGVLERVSVASGGAEASGASSGAVLSHDGRFAVFSSVATDLVAGDSNERRDLFRRDRAAGLTERFALGASGAEPGEDCHSPVLDALGGRLAFVSVAALDPADANGVADVFVRDCTPGAIFASGSGGAPCPCGNAGAWNAGCANSAGPGAALAAQGEARTGADSLTLRTSGLPPGTNVLFFQGSAPIPPAPFGDGLRAVGGSLLRLGVRAAPGGSAGWGFGVPGAPLLSVQGGVPAGGDWRYYQAWYRNAAPFCTEATWNLSNGFEVLWGP
jgi:Tol biopolymer transport system component